MTTHPQKYKYPTVESMYAEDDLGNDPIFPGNFINYGYWKDITVSDPITLDQRLDSQANLYRAIFNSIAINENDTVLEVGCGRGRGLKLLVEEIAPTEVYGVDFSAHQVQRSLDVLAGADNVHVEQAPAEDLPFAQDKFSKVYSVEAIQHFKSPKTFVDQLGKVVKDGGAVAITSFFATDHSAVAELAEMFPTIRRGVDNAIDINQLSTWLNDSGFQDVTIVPIGKHVWKQFVDWCIQVKPEEVSTNWLEAYDRNLLDYYIITAHK